LRCGAARTAVASRVQHGAERHSLGRRRGKGMRRYSGGSPALDGLHAAPARGVQGVVVAGVGVGCHNWRRVWRRGLVAALPFLVPVAPSPRNECQIVATTAYIW